MQKLYSLRQNWDEYLNPGGVSCKSNTLFVRLSDHNKDGENDSDNEHHPMIKIKSKVAASYALPADSELLRATACTLPDNHDFLLGNSFDASFGGSGTTKVSSSQIGGFGFDDTFDGLDIEEGVGDDLVRELGEGWGASPTEENAASNPHHDFSGSC